jgi:hypothetical protein
VAAGGDVAEVSTEGEPKRAALVSHEDMSARDEVKLAKRPSEKARYYSLTSFRSVGNIHMPAAAPNPMRAQ